MNALLIADEAAISAAVRQAFHERWPNGNLLVASTIRHGMVLLEQEEPDLVLLQAGLGDLTLATLISEVRNLSSGPLLVLAMEGSRLELVTALELGADDYVRYQVNYRELSLRMFACLRRTRWQSGVQIGTLQGAGLFNIDSVAREVTLSHQRVTLTPTEFRLLELLVRNRESVVSHESMEHEIWGESVGYRVVRKYISNLRRKLGDDPRVPRWIATVPRVGYQYVGPPPGPA